MSLVVKRSISIRGHRTSFSLEQPFFDDLARIATARGMPLAALVAEIDGNRPSGANLSSAIRLHVLEWAKSGHVEDPSKPGMGVDRGTSAKDVSV
ncbi:ribbon-helix-helix domain-containing protein [Arvimicrobium flavum]|uniref:ribbon-helix-helix domain-containing protein n=1 Tax=Arvimicrobium flavum TaxID=3393320 RepID=UPI00237AD7BA|nr:ribbon-helix-helix domain-containing protein [Mesorhizobium shangrilense]